jgi:hypothetical protein
MNRAISISSAMSIIALLAACTGTAPNGETSQTETPPVDAGATTSGRVEHDEMWDGEILLTGDIEIPAGVTVHVQPGTTIRFTAQCDDQHSPEEYDPQDESTMHTRLISIYVMGTLDAQGTSQSPIQFISDNQDAPDVDWESILIEGDGSVMLDHVMIRNSHFGVQLNSSTLRLSIKNATFQDINTCAICGHGARPAIHEPVIIEDSRFIRCGRECIDTYPDQEISVRHNVFAENHVGIMAVGSSITIEGNLFINNGRGIGIIEGGTPSITGNVITQTQGAAIFVTDASPLITQNNLQANLFNLQLEGGSQDVSAEDNWWGSSDPQVIGESIFDWNDDANLGVVDFEPYSIHAFDLDVPEYE